MSEHDQDQSKRIAQRRLALEVIQMIHGTKEAEQVETQHKSLFRPATPPKAVAIDDPNAPDLNVSLNPSAPHISAQNFPSPHVTLPHSLVYNQPIARVLFAAGLVASRSEGHRLATKRGAYIGGRRGVQKQMRDGLDFTPIENWKPEETSNYIIEGRLLILRVGKWKVKVVQIVSDEEFDDQGLDAPGWAEWKEGRKVYADEEQAKQDEAQVAAGAKQARKASYDMKRRQRDEEARPRMDPAKQERLQAFMRGKYRQNTGEGPTYVDWLRRESKLETLQKAKALEEGD